MPTVAFGEVNTLTLLNNDPAYADNQLRQDLWRAYHAHAGVPPMLSLALLRYIDEAVLSRGLKSVDLRASALRSLQFNPQRKHLPAMCGLMLRQVLDDPGRRDVIGLQPPGAVELAPGKLG